MELFTLNTTSISAPTYQPYKHIPQFKSLVWTERYRDPGDFTIDVLASTNNKSVLAMGNLLSHSETNVIMIIENHEIKTDSDGDRILTVSGRSFETFLENRIVYTHGWGYLDYSKEPYLGEWPPTLLAITRPDRDVADAASVLILATVGGFAQEENDKIPGVSIVRSVPSRPTKDPAIPRIIDKGEVYASLISLLASTDIAIKPVRSRNVGQIIFQTYSGTDRSTSVVLHDGYGDLEDTTYLWSNISKNMAVLDTSYGQSEYGNVLAQYLLRKSIHIDGREFDPKGDGNFLALDVYTGARNAKGAEVLAANKPTAIMNGKVSATARYKLGRDYYVGDIITINGDFGITQKMRVTEGILSADSNGVLATPTLALYEG